MNSETQTNKYEESIGQLAIAGSRKLLRKARNGVRNSFESARLAPIYLGGRFLSMILSGITVLRPVADMLKGQFSIKHILTGKTAQQEQMAAARSAQQSQQAGPQ